MTTYRINDSTIVNPQLNKVNEVKIEPRIMKLLCLLIENKGKLVSRSYITELIWDGYGGADEGLTQAISFLRKILQDNNRKAIETIPKSGYIFNGKVDIVLTEKEVTNNLLKSNPGTLNLKYAAVAGLILIVLFGYITTQKSGQNKNPATKYSFGDYGGNHDSIHALKHVLKRMLTQYRNKPLIQLAGIDN